MYPGYKQILLNMKELTRRKGMKQCVLANRVGFTPQELTDIYGERKLLRVEHLPRIADALGVEIRDLFYLPEEKGTQQWSQKNKN